MLKFEPAEVVGVSQTSLGVIRALKNVSQQNEPISSAKEYLPLDSNTLQIPVVGEKVLVTEFGGSLYYFSKLNTNNQVTNDSDFGSSRRALGDPYNPVEFSFGRYFQPTLRARKLKPCEGDTIIQGRFGNSIRLGSNQSQSLEEDDDIFTESPNVKIVAGGFTNLPTYNESLVPSDDSNEFEEQSSLYLTTKEYVNYEDVLSNSNVNSKFKKDDKTYLKPQVIIQSDRIVFNSRGKDLGDGHQGGGIGIYASDDIEIKSTISTSIDSPRIDVGSKKLQRAVLGNEDFKFIIEIVIDGKIESNIIAIAEAALINDQITVDELTEENENLLSIKTGLTYLSKKVKIEGRDTVVE